MRPPWTPPPAADTCLSQTYSSSPQPKGGTVIDDTVLDLAAHEARLVDPDSYRPKACSCGGRLHVHDRRERRPRQLVVDGAAVSVVQILVFICSRCAATWRVLPAFLARCLWRTWDVVDREVNEHRRGSGPAVPPRTVQRWRARLHTSARVLVQVLAVAGGNLRALAEAVGPDVSRWELLRKDGRGLAALAVLLHRLAPGIRLM
jgi:hypothetical protein